jgi:hypothetical protein
MAVGLLLILPGATGVLVVRAASSVPPDFTVIWKSVEAEDYHTYVANLQAIGCPAQTIRDIVTADLNDNFQKDRQAALQEFYDSYPYWKTDANTAAARATLAGRRHTLDAEMARALKMLLGVATPVPDTASRWRNAELDIKLAFLPDDKRDKVKSILEAHEAGDRDAKALADGNCVSVDTNVLQGIVDSHDQERADLRELLSAEEFQRVEMATSWTGENLRQAMTHFSPTEEEFRVIFAAWKAHDEHLVRIYAAREPDPGNDAVFEEIKTHLAEARYNEYRQTWWK